MKGLILSETRNDKNINFHFFSSPPLTIHLATEFFLQYKTKTFLLAS